MKPSVLLLFIAVMTLFACRQPKDLVYKDIDNFKFHQDGIKQSQISLNLRMYNPNRFSLKLKDANMDVYLNGHMLGKVNITDNVRVPKLDTFLLPVMINVDLKNILPNALQLLINSVVDIKLAGEVRAGKHGFYIHVPVNYEGKQDIKAGLKF